MTDIPDIPRIARLLADPARSRMLWALIDGTTRPAGELAYAADISAPSASMHLAKLVEGGLLVAEATGRHRYFRIANAEVAAMIEGMASLSAASSPRIPPHPALVRKMPSGFQLARTCYDHLAGEIAVMMLGSMRQAGWLADAGPTFEVTPLGNTALATLDIDCAAIRRGRRALARPCVDLTQRRPHLSGLLGAAFLDLFVARRWILRSPRSRLVTITPDGRTALKDVFKLAI